MLKWLGLFTSMLNIILQVCFSSLLEDVSVEQGAVSSEIHILSWLFDNMELLSPSQIIQYYKLQFIYGLRQHVLSMGKQYGETIEGLVNWGFSNSELLGMVDSVVKSFQDLQLKFSIRIPISRKMSSYRSRLERMKMSMKMSRITIRSSRLSLFLSNEGCLMFEVTATMVFSIYKSWCILLFIIIFSYLLLISPTRTHNKTQLRSHLIG